MNTFAIGIPNLPGICHHCGFQPGGQRWPVSCHALEVIIVCPACRSRLGRIVAVPPGDEPSQREES